MFRPPLPDELRLLAALVARAKPLVLDLGWSDKVEVSTMDDGGMGSLQLRMRDDPPTDRMFGACVAELEFEDADGVPVFAALHVDQHGKAYELDVGKVDSSRLVRIPDSLWFGCTS